MPSRRRVSRKGWQIGCQTGLSTRSSMVKGRPVRGSIRWAGLQAPAGVIQQLGGAAQIGPSLFGRAIDRRAEGLRQGGFGQLIAERGEQGPPPPPTEGPGGPRSRNWRNSWRFGRIGEKQALVQGLEIEGQGQGAPNPGILPGPPRRRLKRKPRMASIRCDGTERRITCPRVTAGKM